MRMTGAERQRRWRAKKTEQENRERAALEAELAGLTVALALSRDTTSHTHNGTPAGEAALPEEIGCLLEDICLRLARIERRDLDGLLLRRLTEIERLVRAGDLHIPPRHTRARPLGAE
jgi:hypothetical protein